MHKIHTFKEYEHTCHLQILTQEDWNQVLFNGMSRTSAWASLYFVALMTFGNYVLFNLLVAILVEGFQESKEVCSRLLTVVRQVVGCGVAVKA